jgi:hypothetical protein
MTHSPEEIRSAALDVLAGRVKCEYELNQFAHLKIGVGKALRERDGLPPQIPTTYPADSALESQDADIFLEVFWDLFRDGIISLGCDTSASKSNFPFFSVTSRGKRVLSGENSYFLHDLTRFESQVLAEIPAIDKTTLIYLKEALQAFRTGCILSSTVMLGVATEHTFLLLLETIDNSAVHASMFAGVQHERTTLRKINKFKNVVDQTRKSFPKELLEDFDTHFLGIQSLIRTFRNEAGHPTGKIIDREQAFINLQLFIPFGRKAYELMAYFKDENK